ncbi:MAG: hypothetical protein QT11_C0001G0100 [archaeon GW2011_AR20]|nr:MAG: hypothetical protein QT11_C0001G0100 [archaeon GW2011_AR20]MBS3160722.1 hypothetical protein [Candidatus Woesearchaeota archaeon]
MTGTIDKNLLDIILPEEGLRFREHFGKVEFTYAEKVEEGCYHEIHEVVPTHISKLGEEKILNYVHQKIEEHKREWKKYEEIEENIRKNHIPIKTKYKGISLEGRIIEATSLCIKVELDKPLRGHSHINFGYASAVMGRYVSNSDHEISKYGYEAAYRALEWAYNDALHKPEKDLVESLNEYKS